MGTYRIGEIRNRRVLRCGFSGYAQFFEEFVCPDCFRRARFFPKLKDKYLLQRQISPVTFSAFFGVWQFVFPPEAKFCICAYSLNVCNFASKFYTVKTVFLRNKLCLTKVISGIQLKKYLI